MDWQWQLVVSIGAPIISSILTQLAACRKSKADLKAVEIHTDAEVKKIKEASDKEIRNIKVMYQKHIEKLRTETEEQIKIKTAERKLSSEDHMEKIQHVFMKLTHKTNSKKSEEPS